MKNLLYITSSASGANSHSSWLSLEILQKLRDASPQINLVIRDLEKDPLPHMDENTLSAFFTAADMHTPTHREALKKSDEAIRQLMDADIMLMAVPMYNFGIPSTLKSWVDHVARAGVTFEYTVSGANGLVRNKKVYLAIATGWIYSEGQMKDFDYTERYLSAVLNFMGMNDITVFRVEGTGIPDYKETAITKAAELINHFDFRLWSESISSGN